MKVRMRALLAGPEGILKPDAIVDLPAPKAKELIAGGFATLVGPIETAVAKRGEETADAPGKSETATAPTGETAAPPGPEGDKAKKDKKGRGRS